MKSLSRVRLLATSWTAAYQAPPSMGFSMQEFWSGVPLPSPSLAVITSKNAKELDLDTVNCVWSATILFLLLPDLQTLIYLHWGLPGYYVNP